MTTEVTIQGIPEVVDRSRKVRAELLARLTAALLEQAQMIKALSQAQTPVITGALRDSAYVSDPVVQQTGGSVMVAIGYRSPYAAKQHEMLNFAHENGNGKFLEWGTAAQAPAIAPSLRAAAKVG